MCTHKFCLQNKMFTDKLCLQNKQMFTKQKFTNKLCLQNKTKVYKHVMFTKQNTKHILRRRVNFEPFHNFSVFHSDDCQFHVVLVFTCYNFVKCFHILLSRCANLVPFRNVSPYTALDRWCFHIFN